MAEDIPSIGEKVRLTLETLSPAELKKFADDFAAKQGIQMRYEDGKPVDISVNPRIAAARIAEIVTSKLGDKADVVEKALTKELEKVSPGLKEPWRAVMKQKINERPVEDLGPIKSPEVDVIPPLPKLNPPARMPEAKFEPPSLKPDPADAVKSAELFRKLEKTVNDKLAVVHSQNRFELIRRLSKAGVKKAFDATQTLTPDAISAIDKNKELFDKFVEITKVPNITKNPEWEGIIKKINADPNSLKTMSAPAEARAPESREGARNELAELGAQLASMGTVSGAVDANPAKGLADIPAKLRSSNSPVVGS